MKPELYELIKNYLLENYDKEMSFCSCQKNSELIENCINSLLENVLLQEGIKPFKPVKPVKKPQTVKNDARKKGRNLHNDIVGSDNPANAVNPIPTVNNNFKYNSLKRLGVLGAVGGGSIYLANKNRRGILDTYKKYTLDKEEEKGKKLDKERAILDAKSKPTTTKPNKRVLKALGITGAIGAGLAGAGLATKKYIDSKKDEENE